jgi:hypothetical protein
MKLVMVVNGFPHQVATPRTRLLRDVVAKVLKDTGNLGQPANSWEVRDMAGALKDQDLTLARHSFKDGQTLFVNIMAGVGGDHRARLPHSA